MPAGDLAARQIWWWFAVAATGAGLALIAKRRAAIHIVAAAILISLPHLIGAPEAPAQPTALPPHLASGFVANALATAAVFWVLLGLALGLLNERVAKEPLAHDTA
jgi:predicted cobalt transporter CbtA